MNEQESLEEVRRMLGAKPCCQIYVAGEVGIETENKAVQVVEAK